MTIRFDTQQLENWFVGEYQGKQPFSDAVLKAYQKTIRKLDAADNLTILRQNKSLNVHPLKREKVSMPCGSICSIVLFFRSATRVKFKYY